MGARRLGTSLSMVWVVLLWSWWQAVEGGVAGGEDVPSRNIAAFEGRLPPLEPRLTCAPYEPPTGSKMNRQQPKSHVAILPTGAAHFVLLLPRRALMVLIPQRLSHPLTRRAARQMLHLGSYACRTPERVSAIEQRVELYIPALTLFASLLVQSALFLPYKPAGKAGDAVGQTDGLLEVQKIYPTTTAERCWFVEESIISGKLAWFSSAGYVSRLIEGPCSW